jgi:putative phage-type endonuclease
MSKSYIATGELTRDEWLQARAGIQGIGSSDVGVILRFNKYKTPFQLWEEKMKDPEPEIPSAAAEWGIRLENVIADAYAEKTGRKVIRDNKIRFHADHPYLFCNIDRLILGPAQRGILEIKTTVSYSMRDWEGEIPAAYYAQVQHQMYCSPYKWGEFCIFILDKRELVTFPFEYNEEYAEKQEAELRAFYSEYLLPKVAPPKMAADLELVRSNPNLIVEASAAIISLCTDLRDIMESTRKLKEQGDLLKDQIKVIMGEAELLSSEGRLIATWKTTKASRKFNEAAFREKHAKLYEKFLVDAPRPRRFTLKGESTLD